MAINPDDIFGKDGHTRLTRHLKELDDVDELIKRAKQAGFDVTQQASEASDMRNKLTNIKRAFYPNKT